MDAQVAPEAFDGVVHEITIATVELERHGTPLCASDLTNHKLIGYIPDLIYADELRYLA